LYYLGVFLYFLGEKPWDHFCIFWGGGGGFVFFGAIKVGAILYFWGDFYHFLGGFLFLVGSFLILSLVNQLSIRTIATFGDK
jgi:hypothetical protein